MELVNVSSRAVVMVIAVGVALVDVQHRRFGIEAEESCTQDSRDRPHLDKSTRIRLRLCMRRRPVRNQADP